MPEAAPAAPPPPPPTWTNLPAHQRGGMVSLSIPMMSFWARALGFVLLFIGTLVAVVATTPGGDCYGTTSTCFQAGSGYLTGAANGLVWAKILWSLGLFFVGAGAGLKLHWALGRSSSSTSDEVRAMIHDRWLNGLMVLVSIVLLWFLFAGSFIRLGP